MESNLIDIFNLDIRKKVSKEVPDVPGGFIDFFDDILGEDGDLITAPENRDGYALAVKIIGDWNLADKNGEKLAITSANLKRLPLKIQKWIAQTVSEILQGGITEKKELPVT